MFLDAWELERFQTAIDLRGRSRVLAMMPFDRPHMISYQCSIATMSLSCTVNEILSFISKNLKRSCNTLHVHFDSSIIMHALVLAISKRNLKCLDSHAFPKYDSGKI